MVQHTLFSFGFVNLAYLVFSFLFLNMFLLFLFVTNSVCMIAVKTHPFHFLKFPLISTTPCRANIHSSVRSGVRIEQVRCQWSEAKPRWDRKLYSLSVDVFIIVWSIAHDCARIFLLWLYYHRAVDTNGDPWSACGFVYIQQLTEISRAFPLWFTCQSFRDLWPTFGVSFIQSFSHKTKYLINFCGEYSHKQLCLHILKKNHQR